MTARIGPLVTLSFTCGACKYERYDQREHRCAAPTVLLSNGGQPRSIGASLETPAWCPLRGAAIARLVEEAGQ